MFKGLRLHLSCVLALMLALPCQAQTARDGGTDLKQVRLKSRQQLERLKTGESLDKTYPLLAKRKMVRTAKKQAEPDKAGTGFITRKSQSKATKAAKPLATADGRELWGNIVSADTWVEQDIFNYGIYSFNSSDPASTMTNIVLNDDFVPNGGGTIVDGYYHFVYYHIAAGHMFAYHFSANVDTWEYDAYYDKFGAELVATDLATAKDGTVYGQFYDESMTHYELGIINYGAKSRSNIMTLNNDYTALGITSDNILYGIGFDGALYKIDPVAKTETKVGDTGLTLKDSNGEVYPQSGEIDQKDNTFYWAAVLSDGTSAMYTVDLASGAATKVGDFADNEQILALMVPMAEAQDDAPAAASGLTTDFRDGSLTGKVGFTAPSTTFAGETLTGELDYDISAAGRSLTTGKTQPGAKVEAEVTVDESGMTTFVVTTSNSAGRSPVAEVQQFVGTDKPNPVTEANLTIDPATGKATLTWTAPTEGVNGGNVPNLKYDIVRYPDNKEVSAGQAETSFTETLPRETIKAYSYGITPSCGDAKGKEAVSNIVRFGDAIKTPYSEDFALENSFALFTTIDANNDYTTWEYDNYDELAAYPYSMRQADDWLITPPISLEGGKEYVITFKAWNGGQYAERLEVKYGDEATAEGMTEDVLAPTELTDGDVRTFEKRIITSSPRDIYIGFHAISDPDKYMLRIDDISVSKGELVTTPDSVTAFTATPGEKGAKSAKVKFTLPKTDLTGSPLSKIDQVKLFRNGEELKSWSEGLSLGQEIEFTDNDVEYGKNSYYVVAYNSDGTGRPSAEKNIYVGPDAPQAPDYEGTNLADNGTSFKLTWTPNSVGQNGGYVDTDEVTYTIYTTSKNDYGETVATPILQVVGGNSADIEETTDEGEQQKVQYGLSASNAQGESEVAPTKVALKGKPYEMPFQENFANGEASFYWWLQQEVQSSWSILPDVSYDDEGGSVFFTGRGDKAWINSGKISLAGAQNPQLVFYTLPDEGLGVKFAVEIQKRDGTVEEAYAVDFADGTHKYEWERQTVDLSKYAAEPYIIVRFRGEGTGSGLSYVDAISVRNGFDKDLSVQLNTPEKARKGETVAVKAKVSNFGSTEASAYTVTLKADGKEVETKESSEPLASYEAETFTFNYRPSVFGSEESAKLEVVATLAGEQNADDNTASATVTLLNPTKPAPASASARTTSAGVEVAWTAPADDTETVSDGFEDYQAWSIDNFGGWTGFDGDLGETGRLVLDYMYENQGEPFSFIIWEPRKLASDVFEEHPDFMPHSGDKFAAAFYSYGEDDYYDADNWLISPLLSGDKQTIKFWAKNNSRDGEMLAEDMELMYSTGGTEITEFKTVKTENLNSGEWTEISFEVPEGAKHFAIHHITARGGAALFVDDVEYTAGAGTLTGYNVYRDGTLVGTVGADKAVYTDAPESDGTYTYAVTALYGDSESAPTTASPVIVTAIEGVEATEGQSFKVHTIDGKLVGTDMKSTSKLKGGIYIVNDKKKVVR